MVTGGAGFIGSNLVDALLARGDEVTVVDDLSTGRRGNLDGALAAGAELVELDIRDGAALAALAAERRPEAVFHLAAQIDVRKSLEDPAFDAAVNVGGTANVLEAARAAERRPRRLRLHRRRDLRRGRRDSSCRSTRDAPIAPLSAYGQSKFAAEGYLALYERLYGLSSIALRLGNVYGPRQDPLGEAGVIAIFCGLLQSGGRPTVFGDGTQTRDYIYVGDVVAAALAAAESTATGPVNVGTGDRDQRARAGRGAGPARRRRELRARVRAAADGRGAADHPRRRPRRARARLAPETSLDDGLRLTLDRPSSAPTHTAADR